MAHSNENLLNPETQMCINDCFDCHSTCLETIAYCLKKGGEYAEESHIFLLQDCSEICEASGNFTIRGSDFYEKVCEMCVEICEACAIDCDKFKDDLPMKACAIACWRCADSCRLMAGV